LPETINYGRTPGQLSLTSVTGGTGYYNYVWQTSLDNVNWIDAGAAYPWSPGPLINSTYFRAKVSSNGAIAYSSSGLVTVNPQLFPGSISPSSVTILSGGSPGTLAGNPASGGTCSGSFTYQWLQSTDGNTFTPISGATGQNYSPGTLSANTWFQREVACGSDVEYTNVSVVSIGPAGTADTMNFIRERVVTRPGILDTASADQLTDPNDVKQVTTYYDGLGRPIQSVARRASPLGKDMVTPMVYDAMGRQQTQYMPYVSASTDGEYKFDALAEQNSFNAAQFPGESFYYGQVNYEPTPLNRVQESFAPGNSWIGNSKGVTSQYLLNTAADSVQIWTIASAVGSIPVSVGSYAAGQLGKKVTTDEQNRKLIVYTDYRGNTILKKTQLSSAPSSGHYGWVCSYYVYDTLQNLRYILQPNAVNAINGSWVISPQLSREGCFRYEYDARRRVVVKKVPGSGEFWCVYDARDRIVMSQDSNQRKQHIWLVTEYDSLNRPYRTGLLSDAHDRSYHQGLAGNSITYPNTATNYIVLTQTYFDDYNWVPGTGSSLPTSMATNSTGNSNYFITTYNTSPSYAVPMTPFGITRGMVTGTAKRIMGSVSQYLYAVSFYDDHSRILQTQSINGTGGMDTITTQYDYSGKPLRTLLNHNKGGNTTQTHILLTKVDYDPTLRPRHIWKNIDNAPADQLIDSIQYDELGRLRAKYLGNGLDSMIYDYNIRGWIAGINLNYLRRTANHYFGMELAYDRSESVISGANYASPLLNGNIAGTIWKSAGDGIDRKYDFTYDNFNRLSGAVYLDDHSGTGWNNNAMDFSVSNLTYDLNGNILSMSQKGFKIGSPGATIDSLIYNYQVGSNKLYQVQDLANDTASLLGDFHYKGLKQDSDYSYDGNGNLVLDNNKNIDSVAYNSLNLPQYIHMKGEGSILYTYDANGLKLQKQVIDSISGLVTTTIYLDGFQYQRKTSISTPTAGVDTLQSLAHEEGRARWAFHKYLSGDSAYAWEYDFVEKDHLGNIRVLLTQQKDTAQYVATMEAAYRNTENALFYGLDSTSYPRAGVPGYPTTGLRTSPDDSVARVNGSGPKTGPAIILKVMSGDKIDVGVDYYYNSMSNNNTPNLSASDLLKSLVPGLAGLSAPAEKAVSTLANPTGSPLLPALMSSINNQNGTDPGKPQAYLNWVLLDNQFNYVAGSSGAMQVGVAGTQSNGQLQPALANSGITMVKSGYLYVYVSNATPNWDVYFDNLSIKHYSGPMLEENHYYPYGLSMAGLCDKAVKTQYTENRYRYNSKELQQQEFADGRGLETYDFGARMQDPQLGVWHNIDPLAESTPGISPYAFGMDNPIKFRDVDGMKTDPNPPTYSGQAQVYLNSLADPGGHDPGWGEEFMAEGGGGNGGSGGTEGTGATGGSDAQSSGDEPNWTFNSVFEQVNIQQIKINGQSVTQLTLLYEKKSSFDNAVLDESEYYRSDIVIMKINIDGDGNFLESTLDRWVIDHNAPDANGADVIVQHELNSCVSIQQISANNFTFTSQEGFEFISNQTTFANIVGGVMSYNRENGTDFPVALASDYLSNVSNAAGIIGLKSQAISWAGMLWGFLAPSAEQIANYPQVLIQMSFTNGDKDFVRHFVGYGSIN
jgi:RHS repeat-associated protein